MTAPVSTILWDDFHHSVGQGRHGSGVNHRARQLGDLLDRTGASVRQFHFQANSVGKCRGLTTALRRLRANLSWTPTAWYLTGREGRRLASAIDELRSATAGGSVCVVWGMPDNWVVPIAAAICKVPLVAAPCDFGVWLDPRVRAVLAPAIRDTRVFCISDAEQWLLRAAGIRADYLPYLPAGDWRDELLAVRPDRGCGGGGYDLALTSATNPYNRAGVRHLAAIVQELGRLPRPLLIGGYGTEEFMDCFPSGSVRVEGTLSDARLRSLLIGARSVVIDQEYGGGVSTRIPDAITAGVPVIATGVAARSWARTPGVYLFETAAEFEAHLSRELGVPMVPPPACDAEARFVEAVRKALGGVLG